MQKITQDIDRIERGLATRGIAVNAFCKLVGINRATWQRWKACDNMPTMRKWIAVQATYEELSS